ncbi:hypothetical protein I79_026227 [Cricetulus griseus]|uniref:Uncharacterized protein n=1 Tax=Cricetulus griseus TaxID=10029 RepID=G3IQB7_CRIGR|nr:hypothetical protein I79_026227 [Cricetulus griseus]
MINTLKMNKLKFLVRHSNILAKNKCTLYGGIFDSHMSPNRPITFVYETLQA